MDDDVRMDVAQPPPPEGHEDEAMESDSADHEEEWGPEDQAPLHSDIRAFPPAFPPDLPSEHNAEKTYILEKCGLNELQFINLKKQATTWFATERSKAVLYDTWANVPVEIKRAAFYKMQKDMDHNKAMISKLTEHGWLPFWLLRNKWRTARSNGLKTIKNAMELDSNKQVEDIRAQYEKQLDDMQHKYKKRLELLQLKLKKEQQNQLRRIQLARKQVEVESLVTRLGEALSKIPKSRLSKNQLKLKKLCEREVNGIDEDGEEEINSTDEEEVIGENADSIHLLSEIAATRPDPVAIQITNKKLGDSETTTSQSRKARFAIGGLQ
ncbi:hypothetical protein DFH27DRAFT_521179 [Peziza echinospora]|nr:hypothetical protein DFH27DRAFT_521179 [Peziza echinospora]